MKDKNYWKDGLAFFLFTLSALSLTNCIARAEFPTGLFLEESSGDVISFQQDGIFTAAFPDGEIYISGTYTFNDNELTVIHSDETLCESELPESYRWHFDGDILSIRRFNEDACLLRRDTINLKLQK